MPSKKKHLFVNCKLNGIELNEAHRHPKYSC